MKKSLLEGESLIVPACYEGDWPPIYQGNPFIEALPNISSTGEISKILRDSPEYDESCRNLPDLQRINCLPDIKRLYVPLNRDIDFFQRIYSEILASYARRPVGDPNYFAKVRRQCSAGPPQVAIGRPGGYASCIFPMVGLSGTGKSTSVGRCLSAIPQAIRHSIYDGIVFQTTQVPWVRITCPSDASPKSLCRSFYRYLDGILDTRYAARFAKGNLNSSELRAELVNLAALHGVALLVIDDLENMSKVQSGGTGQLLNFIYNLSEEMGAPIILISTYEGLPLVSDSLRSRRRGTELGWDPWERLTGNEWEKYFKKLWGFQYTRVKTRYSTSMSEVFLEESLGIPGLAWVLFKLTQERAINTSKREGSEKITANLVRSVAKDNFKLLKQPLNALRSGKQDKLVKFPDLTPDQFTSDVERKKNNKPSQSTESNDEQIENELPKSDLENDEAFRKSVHKKRQDKSKNKSNGGIFVEIAGSTDSEESVHRAFVETGVVLDLSQTVAE